MKNIIKSLLASLLCISILKGGMAPPIPVQAFVFNGTEIDHAQEMIENAESEVAENFQDTEPSENTIQPNIAEEEASVKAEPPEESVSSPETQDPVEADNAEETETPTAVEPPRELAPGLETQSPVGAELSEEAVIPEVSEPVAETENESVEDTFAGTKFYANDLSFSEIPAGCSVSLYWEEPTIAPVACNSAWNPDTHTYSGIKSAAEPILIVENTSEENYQIRVRVSFSSTMDTINGSLKENKEDETQSSDLVITLQQGEKRRLWFDISGTSDTDLTGQTVEIGTLTCQIVEVIDNREVIPPEKAAEEELPNANSAAENLPVEERTAENIPVEEDLTEKAPEEAVPATGAAPETPPEAAPGKELPVQIVIEGREYAPLENVSAEPEAKTEEETE